MSQGKFALITGANKGIGLAAARELGRRGVSIYLAARDLARGQEAARQLQAEKIDARPVHLDVTDARSIEQARQLIEQDAGRLDILVNNAGISGRRDRQLELATLRQVWETNVFGAYAVTEAFLPLLERARPSRILNISSGLGSLAQLSRPTGEGKPRSSLLAYCTSKSALNAITAFLAGELQRRGITVLAINPGYTATDMNNGMGIHPPERPARLIADLALDSDTSNSGRIIDDNGKVGEF